MPETDRLLLCADVSVIAAAVVGEKVVLCADRAAVRPGEWLAPGVPVIAPDLPKLFSSATGCAAAIAGTVATKSGDVDMLTPVRVAIGEASTALEAAGKIRSVLSANAAAIVASTVSAGSAPGQTRVATAVLVAGPGSAGPELYVVTLPASGGPGVLTSSNAMAFAPSASQGDVTAATRAAIAAGDSDRAVEQIGSAIVEASVRDPGMVSPDWDHVVVTASGVNGPTLTVCTQSTHENCEACSQAKSSW